VILWKTLHRLLKENYAMTANSRACRVNRFQVGRLARSDTGDVDGASVDEFPLFVAGCDCSGLAKLVDGALDDVAGLVDHFVECGWPSALAARATATGDLGGPAGIVALILRAHSDLQIAPEE
jgi:hypothetical protein